MNTIHLNTCPFCGAGKARFGQKRKGNYQRTGTYIMVMCGKCHARGPLVTQDHGTRREPKACPSKYEAQVVAARLWNRTERTND